MPQVNFHTTLSGESLVTLVYHRALDDVWREAALQLRALLAKCPATQGNMPQVMGALHGLEGVLHGLARLHSWLLKSVRLPCQMAP